MADKELALNPSEKLLALSGVFILTSAAIIASGGGFGLWVAAKILYGAGVILFLFEK